MSTATPPRRQQPVRACRAAAAAAAVAAPPPERAASAAAAPLLPLPLPPALDARAMLERAKDLPAPVRRLLAKQDAETVAFVGTCLSDLRVCHGDATCAHWMCQGRKRAGVLAAVFEKLCGARATVQKEDGLALYEVALAWEAPMAVVPSIPKVYLAAAVA
jgi:hypothetical protein